MTETEKHLWKYLRNKQIERFKFRRQQPIGRYIVDFVNFENKLVIEVDGGQHAVYKKKDIMRDEYLKKEGYQVLRFWDNEVLNNTEGVMEIIINNLLLSPSPKSSPLAGEGKGEGDRVKALGVVAPHAGYIYSGAVAGAVYGRVLIPELVVILGPNHTGMGPSFSIMAEGSWQTPLGEVRISGLAGDLLKGSSLLESDESSHRLEHSLEVQLPFLQVVTEFEFIPIIIGSLQAESLAGLGREIAGFIRKSKKETLIIASSDMSHYEPDEVAREKDRYALEAVLALDVPGLLSRVAERDISMCGVGPTAVMLTAVKELGAQRVELVKYATSGDVSGDYQAVVGYAGLIIT